MKTSLPSAGKKALKRFRQIRELGCVACWLDDHPGVAPDIHHILSGGKRISHMATIGLCPWHHRGVAISGYSDAQMTAMMGPSMALNKRQFTKEYGLESSLLDLTNNMLEDVR